MIDSNYYVSNGYINDTTKETLITILAGNDKISKLHFDVLLDEPNMLLSRSKYKNVTAEYKNGKLKIYKKDTVIMNLYIDEIEECFINNEGVDYYNIAFNILNKNIEYNMFITV